MTDGNRPRTRGASHADRLGALHWRLVGPYRGGRVVAVAGHPTERLTFYFGSTGGGVWRTTTGGLYWDNLSDGFFRRASVGALAVAPSDPNVLYAGMGECCLRNNVSHGDGVYRSMDGGKTWEHRGLAATRHIGRLRVDPRDPDSIYVAALGHAHGPNTERGVFRSRDGGKSWRRVLYRGPEAGVVDLAMDTHNPRVLFASAWQVVRRPWGVFSGGEASGIFRTSDGGETWEDITRRPGLPNGVLGRIGVAVSPAKRDRVWALVEAEDGGVFRSDDGGDTWTRLAQEGQLTQRPFYYSHIFAHPTDPQTVWVLNVQAWRSSDGGRSFTRVQTPHLDQHDLWIDPDDPMRMIEGNDGGATISFDAGVSWSRLDSQPTAELYHVTTDGRSPYRVYGAQQDNTTISIPSRSTYATIAPFEYIDVGGGEAGHIAVRRSDPDVIYAGSYQGYLTRYDRRTLQMRNVMVWPEWTVGSGAEAAKHRFQWTYPIVLSPHDDAVVYVGAECVFRSKDAGMHWEPISPDLTRHEAETLGPSGGPLTKDNVGADYYGTIFSFAESPLERGVLWAGSDDGLIHVSRDDGRSWRNVTPPRLPGRALITALEPSRHRAGTAYVAATRYRLDDFRPYLLRTDDYGRTWRTITAGIPVDEPTRVIREDPVRPELLFAGTEAGLYGSFDGGRRWERLNANLPVVPIHDLVVEQGDLVAATHGRGFWVLDDLTPLRGEAQGGAALRIFTPRPTARFVTNPGFSPMRVLSPVGVPDVGINYLNPGPATVAYRAENAPGGAKRRQLLESGENAPDGALLWFELAREPKTAARITVRDRRRRTIRTIEAPGRRGLNRVVWDMRHEPAEVIAGDPSMRALDKVIVGPIVPPGAYRVRVEVDGSAGEVPLEIVPDPRPDATQEDLEAQCDLLLQIRDKLSQTHRAVMRLREIARRAAEIRDRASSRRDRAVATSARRIVERASTVEERLIQSRVNSPQDIVNYPIRLNAKLGALAGAVAQAAGAPTASAREAFAELSRRIDEQLEALAVLERDLGGFDQLVRRSGVEGIVRGEAS